MIRPEVFPNEHFEAVVNPVNPEDGRRMDRWMAMLAHELRDPLNAITMALEELHPVCADAAEARRAREMATDGARQMQRIIEDVLDLYRHRRGDALARDATGGSGEGGGAGDQHRAAGAGGPKPSACGFVCPPMRW